MDVFLDDILQEILSRLPVRSLMQCRLVCRLWRNLTHDLHFTRVHTTRTLASKPGIMLTDRVFKDDGSCFDKLFFMDRRISAPIPKSHHVKLSFLDNFKEFNILNSCNGLLLLRKRNDDFAMFVCNPFIRKFIAIPHREYYYPIGANISTHYYSGFCPKTQLYKLLEISLYSMPGGIEFGYLALYYVHKLGDESWNRINSNVPIITRKSRLASNINGAIHLVDYYNCTSLTVFDLEHEVFREMPGPLLIGANTETGSFSTIIIENCLSIINYNCGNVDVWIMKEYSISWEKCFVINLGSLVLTRKVRFEVLNYEEDGSELLILNNPRVLTYNLKENVFTTILPLEGWNRAVPHYDTLVSPLE